MMNHDEKIQEPTKHGGRFVKDTELEALLVLLEEQRLKESLQNFSDSHTEQTVENPHHDGLLTDIFNNEEKLMHLEEKNERARFMAYLDDLSFVLRLSNGAGIRILRHWLDASYAFAPIFSDSPQIYATAALADFARERMAEIALADPAGHVRLQLVGARQMAEMVGKTFVSS